MNDSASPRTPAVSPYARRLLAIARALVALNLIANEDLAHLQAAADKDPDVGGFRAALRDVLWWPIARVETEVANVESATDHDPIGTLIQAAADLVHDKGDRLDLLCQLEAALNAVQS